VARDGRGERVVGVLDLPGVGRGAVVLRPDDRRTGPDADRGEVGRRSTGAPVVTADGPHRPASVAHSPRPQSG